MRTAKWCEKMPLLKYFTLAVALSSVAAEGPCVDQPDVTLPGGWDCARIAEYIAGSDVHSCSWAGPWLSVMVAPQLAEEAAQKCPLSYDDAAAEAEEPAAQPAAAAPEPTEAEEPAEVEEPAEAEEPAEQPAAGALEPEPTFEKSTVAEAVAIDVNADTIDYEAKWAPMEVVIALFIFVTCAFSMTRLCRAKEDQYAPVTRAISEEDLVAPEDDVERGPTLEDKRRMLD